jgi:hypothetical protein
MKAKIAIATSALLIVTSSMAYAYDPVGTKVPFDSAIDCEFGKGIEGNATTKEQWYVCVPKRETTWIFREPIINNPTPVIDTATAITNSAPVINATPNDETVTVTSNATPVVTETTTATVTSVTVQSLYAQIMALFTQLLALIAKLQG